MRPRRTPTCNQVYRLPGGTEDTDLWVEMEIVTDQTLGRVPAISSTWELTDDERRRIAAGDNLRVTIIGTQQPPLDIQLSSEELGKGGDNGAG